MKKLDTNIEDEDIPVEAPDGEYPTAVYTVYNVHGEPIGHRLYSYQPVYEPEEDDIIQTHEDISEYQDDGDLGELPNVTVLKGGLFPDHGHSKENENNINKLKHQYFVRYLDKRRKRYSSSKNGDDVKKEMDIELQGADSKKNERKHRVNLKKDLDLDLEAEESKSTTTVTGSTVIPRVKRDVISEEYHREWTTIPSREEYRNEIMNNMLEVIPLQSLDLEAKATVDSKSVHNVINSDDKEMVVIPLQYKSTSSTEVVNILDKRDKRTSRKTDRLNQTTATIPKT